MSYHYFRDEEAVQTIAQIIHEKEAEHFSHQIRVGALSAELEALYSLVRTEEPQSSAGEGDLQGSGADSPADPEGEENHD